MEALERMRTVQAVRQLVADENLRCVSVEIRDLGSTENHGWFFRDQSEWQEFSRDLMDPREDGRVAARPWVYLYVPSEETLALARKEFQAAGFHGGVLMEPIGSL
jgi:hypothetical protein